MEAGWYEDPRGVHEVRWWDGKRWTVHVATAGLTSSAVAVSAPPPSGGVPVPFPPPAERLWVAAGLTDSSTTLFGRRVSAHVVIFVAVVLLTMVITAVDGVQAHVEERQERHRSEQLVEAR